MNKDIAKNEFSPQQIREEGIDQSQKSFHYPRRAIKTAARPKPLFRHEINKKYKTNNGDNNMKKNWMNDY